MAPSSRSWCVACTLLLGECTQECVFAPYIPPEDPLKFLMVHKVFGASNVAKTLNDLPVQDRKNAVRELAYEEIWNSMFGMDGGGAGRSVLTVVHGLLNLMSMMGGMPSSSNNPLAAKPADSDHQNPQMSPAAAGESSVHHHHLFLQQQILQHQQQLYLQQQQGQVSPAGAGASSVHHHHLSLQQQEGQDPALHLKGADKRSAGPSS